MKGKIMEYIEEINSKYYLINIYSDRIKTHTMFEKKRVLLYLFCVNIFNILMFVISYILGLV